MSNNIYDLEEPLTSTTRPATEAIITIRVIKSFPYRNVKNHVIHNIDLTKTSVKQLKEEIDKTIATEGAFRPFRNVKFDTLKVYTKAHGSKSMNLVINLMDDDAKTILYENDKTLQDCGIENETEISYFNMEAYEEYKKNPTEEW